MMFYIASMLSLVAMIVGTPVFVAFLFGSYAALSSFNSLNLIQLTVTRFIGGLDMFPFLAVPLFLFVGEVMTAAKITDRLIQFANSVFGHMHGGLGHANIGSSMLFAGISGSAVADTSAIGGFMIPAMVRNGYPRAYAVGVTCASSVIGPIIPPSIIMVIYATIMNVSVAKLFAAAIIPGLLMGVALMIVNHISSKISNFPRYHEHFNLSRLYETARSAILPMGAPVIILGGIVGGIFTATEAAAVACVYVCILGLFVMKSIRIIDLYACLMKAALTTSTILIVVAAASAFSFIGSISGIGQDMRALFMGIGNPIIFFLMINLLLLLTGMILDAVPAIIIFGSVITPAAAALGINEIHLAVVMSINLSIGLITPPMGVVLFVGSKVGEMSVPQVAKAIIPQLVPLLIVLLITSLFPWVSLALPNALGM